MPYALQEQGYEIDLVDIKRDGTVDLEQLSELIRKDTVMVVVCAVDSELGTVQPIEKITETIKNIQNVVCTLTLHKLSEKLRYHLTELTQ